MALDPQHPAPRPAIVDLTANIHPGDTPRLHWYGEPGHPGDAWTPEAALATTIWELTVHWEQGPVAVPAGQPEAYYRQQLGQIAHFHAFERNWNDGGPFLAGDGIMYHYVIAPAPAGSNAALIYQVTAETHRTWNAYDANPHNLAVVLLAGPHDPVYPAMQAALRAVLDWMTGGRGDLPLVTARAGRVVYQGRPYQSVGVLTHDESLRRQGRPPKGCCGIYGPTVTQWRAGLPL